MRFVPHYPDDFDLVNGVAIPDEKINEWVQELAHETQYTWIKSGNTIVIKTVEGHIIVTKNYWIFEPEE